MELLYFIDRTITRALQKFSRKCDLRHLNMSLQSLLIILLLYPVQLFVEPTEENLWVIILYGATTIAIWYLLKNPVASILQHLHRFFDLEEASSKEKLFEDGYKCWAEVTVSVLFIAIGISFPQFFWAQLAYKIGVGAFGVQVYEDFVNRRKGQGRKRKNVVTAALQALLERCKDFLPRPIPEPSPIQKEVIHD